MGRQEQKPRERKQVAASSQRLEQFLQPKPKAVVSAEDIDIASSETDLASCSAAFASPSRQQQILYQRCAVSLLQLKPCQAVLEKSKMAIV